MQKEKEGTARVTLYKLMHCPNIFTCETSFFRSDGRIQFTPENLMQVGRDFCNGLVLHFQDKLVGFEEIEAQLTVLKKIDKKDLLK